MTILTSVFHAGRPQVHLFECYFCESAHTTLGILSRAAGEQTSDVA